MNIKTELDPKYYSIKCDLWHNVWKTSTGKEGFDLKVTYSIRSTATSKFMNFTSKLNSERRFYARKNPSSEEHQRLVESHLATLDKHAKVSKVVRYGYGKGSSNTSIRDLSTIFDHSNQCVYLWMDDTAYLFELDDTIISEKQKNIEIKNRNKTYINNVIGSATLYSPHEKDVYDSITLDEYLAGDF